MAYSAPIRAASNGAVVQIRLLGGVSATSDDGDLVDVGPGRCQAVLAGIIAGVFANTPEFGGAQSS